MPSPSFTLRVASSGPVVTGTPGYVLTIDPDGNTVSAQPTGAGETFYVVQPDPVIVDTVIDLATHGRFQRVVIGASVRLSFVGAPIGVSIIEIYQDATGGHAVTIAGVLFQQGVAPIWSTSPSAENTLGLFCDGTELKGMPGLNWLLPP